MLIKININATHMIACIPNCMTAQHMQQAMANDKHLQQLGQSIIRGWPESRNEVPKGHIGHSEVTWQ